MAKILVVEDESIIATDLERTLGEMGHEVVGIAATGAEALSKAASESPELVLMDIRLPGPMDGIETVKAIRQKRRIPVVFLTAFADAATVARAALTEPYGYLLKPFNDRELRSAIELAIYRGRMDAQLRAREQWLFTTLLSIGDGVISTDPDERILFLNPVAERLLGVESASAVGRQVGEVFRVVSARDGKTVELPIRAALKTAQVTMLAPDALLVTAGGKKTPVSDSAAPVRGEDGELTGAVLVFRDVTEQQRLEARLALTDRLAALGTMTAAIAHEINNPLAYDLANQAFATEQLERLRDQLATAPGQPFAPVVSTLSEVLAALAEAGQGARQVQRIIKDLRSFTRIEVKGHEPVSLSAVVEGAIRMASNQLKHHARLVQNIGPAPLVWGAAGQLTQVVVNLLVNAVQAFERPDLERNEVTVTVGTSDAGAAVIEVADNGRGMPPEVMVRIFDPFFTTKQVGVGMGLGLSICHKLIEAHKGEISVRSEPGKGTAFTLTLPALRDEQAHPTASASPPGVEAAAARASADVLVVDDEELLARAIARVLRPFHRVQTVSSATEAVTLLKSGRAFDVILCDLMMPGMSGMAFHQWLQTERPIDAGRVLFLSGGAFTPETHAFVQRMGARILGKPFDSAQLLRAVDEAARGGPSSAS